ncbi:MAG: replicative DNA helicase [Marinilabiliales bacterium]
MAKQYKHKDDKSIIQNAGQQIGKLPPQVIELEEAVLGAIMLEKDAVHSALEVLKPECFYKDEHRIIYEAIIELSKDLKPIDILTVTELLRKQKKLDEVGGPSYIAELTSKVATAAHIEFHAKIIAQKFIQRELIRISSEIQKRAFDDSEDVDDLLDFSENELFNVSLGLVKKQAAPIYDIIQESVNTIKKIGEQEAGLSGVPSGFTQLDRITSGWQKSDLIIIAARPSMGKTSFVLSMARNIAVEHKRPLAIFSLEMSSVQLANRLIVSESEIAAEKIRNGKLSEAEWKQLLDKISDLEQAPIYIDDTPAISIFELRAKCRRLKLQHKIELVIVDYLQLMSAGGDNKGNREQEVSNISRALKALAKELDIPVIALSQLNRSVEMRAGDKRPQLSDLRESGAIEQDADVVIFIHRPEKYGLTEDDEGSTKGRAEIIIAKHRNGAIGDIRLHFREKFAQFTDADIYDEYDSPVASMTLPSKMNQDFIEGENLLKQNINFDDSLDNNDDITPF